ncbi:MAG: metallophosphoesterase [Candidatus Electryonea clarkiae]|nr:metallophosphoesterase [Candidatus Electryonea clarkiae]MDP8285092.1 metallophosphoesterase [Candidatus Electryonea clarkiae]
MRLGIMTDSHDHLRNLGRAVLEFKRRNAEAIIHSGDFVAPFTIDVLKHAGCPVYSVYGNCDGERIGLSNRFKEIHEKSEINTEPHIYELDGLRIVVMHHPAWIESFASTKQADIIVYGHLHKLHIENRPPWIINPGEVFGLKADPTAVWFDTSTPEPEILHLKNLSDLK